MSSSPLAAGLRHLRGRMAVQNHNADSDEQLLSAFTIHCEKDAFAILVRRHGPMVLHVCRRVLGHEQDAEDAFQATFLLLAHGAAGVRNKTALAGFLHGTAYRIALNAKRSAARRRKYEGCLGALTQPRSPADPTDELSWREVRALLDEELARLPEKYRSAFVLCCLEELSQAEAARHLGVNERTLSSRLAEARKRLAQRLTRRGVELTGVLAAITSSTRTASALPVGLMAATINAASSTAAGERLAGVVSTSVAEMLRGATASLMLSKAKIASVVLLLVAPSGSLVGWLGRASGPLAATTQPPIETMTVDFALKRGTWIKGRITDKSTGKAVGGHIEYFCFTDNPNAKEVPFELHTYCMRWTEDGSFLIPAMPGHGLIAVRANEDKYIMGAGAEHIKARKLDKLPNYFSTAPRFCQARNIHALVEINPKPGESVISYNFALDPGRSLKGTVLGPDGKPLAGARISGLTELGDWMDSGVEFTVKSLQDNKPRVLEFKHNRKKLAGVFVLRGDEPKPISVRLEPWAALTGRLVSLRGEPLAGLNVDCRMEAIRNGKTLDTTTFVTKSDKDGRFRIEGLAGGQHYHDFSVIKGVYGLELVGGGPKKFTLKAGETKDVGDLTVKPME